MRKHIALALASTALTPVSLSQTTTWSQSTDNTTIVAGSASCFTIPDGIVDNSYWRNYDPLACGVAGDYEILSVTFGVENASTGTSGMQLITVNIRDGGGFPVGASMAPILGTDTVVVPDTVVTMQTFHTAVFNPPIFVPAGTLAAVEVMAPNGQPQGDFFFIGSNGLGETPVDSTYISAPDCGVIDPVPYSAVGFGGVHGIIDLSVNDLSTPVGSSYCSPAVPNSTGVPGILSAFGSTSVSDNLLTIRAEQLPPGQFAFFLTSQTQDMTTPMGSSGVLCLGGNIGRFDQAAQIIQGSAGNISVDLDAMPVNPPQPVVSGETWNFQCWYRDTPMGATNNFTDAVSVTFN